MESSASLRLLLLMLLMGISQGFKQPSSCPDPCKTKELMVKINSLADDVKPLNQTICDLKNIIKTQGDTIEQLTEMTKMLLSGQKKILQNMSNCPKKNSTGNGTETGNQCVCSSVNNQTSCDCTTRKPERDCEAHQNNNATRSGVYMITINNKVTEVYCDMETTEGGWTVLQRRVDGSQDFDLGWTEYKTGFGNRSASFWFGLQQMYQMTSADSYKVRFDMTRSDGKTGWTGYQSFKVGPETSGYKLAISGQMSGDVSNHMTYNNGMKFSTKDNDQSSVNCAARYKGGFWFHSCYDVHLNGVYGERGYNGIAWVGFSWGNDPTSITYIDMKIKRN